MKLEDQVLSIEQVQELQELGFNVKKHSSIYYVPNWITKYGIDEIQDYDLVIGELREEDIDCIPTLTIGDIIDVLPERIKTYSANADKEIYFYPRINNTGIIYVPAMIDDCIFYSSEDKLINNLFKTLVWCIKEKHIKL